jgi:hypothetical protein
MSSSKSNSLIEVFAGTTWQARMVKSLLENSEINAFLKDEHLGTLNPWWVAAGGVGAVKVFVSSLDHEKAKFMVEEYEKNSIDN